MLHRHTVPIVTSKLILSAVCQGEDEGRILAGLRYRLRLRLKGILAGLRYRLRLKGEWANNERGVKDEPKRAQSLPSNSNLIIPISLQPDGINPWYFKLKPFDIAKLSV